MMTIDTFKSIMHDITLHKGWTIRYPGRGGVRSKKKIHARN